MPSELKKKKHFTHDFIEHKSDYTSFFYGMTMKSLYNVEWNKTDTQG